jgi:transcriptional regulator of arginine metabolism
VAERATARAPLTKNARHALVVGLLTGRPVRSQQELGVLLAEAGVHVTQATLSRDLGELGAYKIRTDDGGLVYALPAAPERWSRGAAASPQLARRLEELLMSAEAAGSTVVLRTPPGGAHLLASSLDVAELPGGAGTLAGDDTVLLVCRTLEGRTGEQVSGALAERLLSTAEGLARTGAEHAAVDGDRLAP